MAVGDFLLRSISTGDLKKDGIVRRKTSPNAGLDECLSLAKRWLTECSVFANPASDFVPSLLVDVELTKLVSPKDDNLCGPDRLRYAALSYCWGNDPFLATTSSNIHAMRQSIPVSELPQTIQDAIVVTRYLGVKYIWVDSLCILQGADQAAHCDWISELGKMGQIYQSAFVTIAAESAPNAYTGILNDRKAPSFSNCALQESLVSSDVVYLHPHVLYGGHNKSFMQKVKEPLHFRGWSLQESILSQRLLSFGTHELSWRCHHVQYMESLCESQTHPSSMLLSPMKSETQNDDSLRVFRNWEDIVEDYSTRLLTKATDKLHAIAGLAEVAQRATAECYVSGAWTTSNKNCEKLIGILWAHKPGKSSFSSAADFKAPSWSWASVEGPIRFLPHVKLKDVVVTQSSRGRLKCNGTILKFDTIRLRNFGSYYGCYDNFLPWADLPDTFKTYLDDLDNIPSKYKKGADGDPMELINSYFLALAKDPAASELSIGLILLPAKTRRNHFRRIGVFEGLHIDRFRTTQQNITNGTWSLGGQSGKERTVKLV